MTTRIIDRHELLRRIPYTLVHIGRLEDAGKFPKRVKIGEHRVGWIEAEIEEWIQARADQRINAATSSDTSA